MVNSQEAKDLRIAAISFTRMHDKLRHSDNSSSSIAKARKDRDDALKELYEAAYRFSILCAKVS